MSCLPFRVLPCSPRSCECVVSIPDAEEIDEGKVAVHLSPNCDVIDGPVDAEQRIESLLNLFLSHLSRKKITFGQMLEMIKRFPWGGLVVSESGAYNLLGVLVH